MEKPRVLIETTSLKFVLLMKGDSHTPARIVICQVLATSQEGTGQPKTSMWNKRNQILFYSISTMTMVAIAFQ
jgi:hypothetical protein